MHGIPVVFWVEGTVNREEAAARIETGLRHSNPTLMEIGYSLPNDTPKEHDDPWHLRWERGVAPQPIDDVWEYEPTTKTIRRIDG